MSRHSILSCPCCNILNGNIITSSMYQNLVYQFFGNYTYTCPDENRIYGLRCELLSLYEGTCSVHRNFFQEIYFKNTRIHINSVNCMFCCMIAKSI